jgi:hypothetical protein
MAKGTAKLAEGYLLIVAALNTVLVPRPAIQSSSMATELLAIGAKSDFEWPVALHDRLSNAVASSALPPLVKTEPKAEAEPVPTSLPVPSAPEASSAPANSGERPPTRALKQEPRSPPNRKRSSQGSAGSGKKLRTRT